MLFEDGIEELVNVKSSIDKVKRREEEMNELNP